MVASGLRGKSEGEALEFVVMVVYYVDGISS